MLSPTAKVLLVDDESEIREVIRYYLEGFGLTGRVFEASSGEEALSMIDQVKPDAVISDIRMTGMSGLELLQELTARENFTPVIFVSAFGDKRVVLEAWRLGAFDFLDKPINAQRLLENLHIALTLGERFNRERSLARRKAAG